MKQLKYTISIFLVIFLADLAFSLKCYNCYIDGPSPWGLLQPKGPIWEKCTGNDEEEDFMYCDQDEVCIEIMLYGDDSSRYQILRSCAYGAEVCNNLELGPEVHVGDCKTCTENACNDSLQ